MRISAIRAEVPLAWQMIFRFRTSGRDHKQNDPDCIGCATMGGDHYPRPHKEFKGTTCLGLVHAEKVDDPAKTVYLCDACNANPRHLEGLYAGPFSEP